MQTKGYSDRKLWFSMWFLGAVVTFGLAFFPMFYRLLDGRNRHFQHEEQAEQKVADFLKSQGRALPKVSQHLPQRNAKVLAASIILVLPIFVIVYLLSRDLAIHEHQEDVFLSSAFPERFFMPQTIPIKTYVVVTVCTLGVGVVYWLYKLVNFYNAHYKAELQVDKEISRLMEENVAVGHM